MAGFEDVLSCVSPLEFQEAQPNGSIELTVLVPGVDSGTRSTVLHRDTGSGYQLQPLFQQQLG